jgi:hypothetical protein
MTGGRYIYCIVERDEPTELEQKGIQGKQVGVVCHKGLGAVASPISYQELQPTMENIIAHQRVVEAARELGTTLPVKFGVIFKTEDGLRSLLAKQHDDYRKKLTKLAGMDEFGIKVLFNKAGMAKITAAIEEKSPEIARMRRSIESGNEGRSYFTKLKMKEAVRTEAYKMLDELSKQVHDELVREADDSTILKSEHEQILLNVAYLVRKERGKKFLDRAAELGKAYAAKGLIVHSSGPWAPYSFC